MSGQSLRLSQNAGRFLMGSEILIPSKWFGMENLRRGWHCGYSILKRDFGGFIGPTLIRLCCTCRKLDLLKTGSEDYMAGTRSTGKRLLCSITGTQRRPMFPAGVRLFPPTMAGPGNGIGI